ncbi:hypothetical protein GF342_05840 [Candidatus Woesearchaeota archaeon]|nr:hypothetical protein [Candidatus Woesearchaeota archaeon]
MKKILALLVLAVALYGCSGPTGGVVANSDWCDPGKEWSWSGSSPDGNVDAQWIMQGIQTSGKYAGLCHVEYTVEGPDGNAVVDYYFNEEGDDGYMVMTMNGEEFAQEWHR